METQALTKLYRGVPALEACTLGIDRGEIFGLLGPNGSGKTTLIRLLVGFLRPTRGSARVDGWDCCRQSLQVRRRVAYLPGEARLWRQMRGHSILRFFSRIRPGGNLAQAQRLAKRLELDLSQRVSLMSTGMRQKLALASCLSSDAPLVVLDEPTSNLDPTARGTVITLVREVRAAGRTVVFSSHVMSEIEDACDRVAILRRGQLVHEQSMSDLRRRHRIRARLAGPLPVPPPAFDGQLEIRWQDDGSVCIDMPGELAPLLQWLATLALTEVRIEPVGLRPIYDRFHNHGAE